MSTEPVPRPSPEYAERGRGWRGSRRWLLPAGAFALVAIAVFVALLWIEIPLPTVGIIIVIAAYAAMVVCAYRVRDLRRRNVAFAALMWGMALCALALVLAVYVVESMRG
jgi:hypothetical protein